MFALLALLACAEERPETPYPDIPAATDQEESPLAPAPVQDAAGGVASNFAVTMPEGDAQVGDKVDLDFSFNLPSSCYAQRDNVTEPQPRTIELALTVEKTADMCAQAVIAAKGTATIPVDEAGEWTFIVSLEGVEQKRSTLTVTAP